MNESDQIAYQLKMKAKLIKLNADFKHMEAARKEGICKDLIKCERDEIRKARLHQTRNAASIRRIDEMKTQNKTKTEQAIIMGALTICLALSPMLAASAKEMSDTDITSAIHTEMWGDNAVSANDIDVTTQDGIVTLEGTVSNILEKERAKALAEAIVGVRAIVNMINVKPTTPHSDKEIATAVTDAWIADPVADAYKLKASANNGVVTLTGTVDSYAASDLSATVAKGVRGVTGIKNDIKVDYKITRSDMEIEAEIKERLKNDVRVDAYLVEVKVKNGNVTLSGTVGSLQEKTQADSDSWVAGVKEVNTDDLTVEWWARDDMKRASTYVSRTDEEIKKAVTSAFFYDPRVLSFNPSVEVSYGTVTLSGEVDNLKAKRAAEQDAKNALGVWRVTNNLKVRPEIPANDVLKQRVATALLDDPYVERYEVTIAAYSGWVYLSGDVNSSFEKNRAERVAEGVKGVVGVVNNLNYDYLWVWKPDWEIRQNVKDQLEWSVFVNEDDISVSVVAGVVTLSGTVDSWSERDDAEKNAYQGGAKFVVNNLVVDYGYYGPYGPGYYASPYYHGPDYYGPSYEPYQ